MIHVESWFAVIVAGMLVVIGFVFGLAYRAKADLDDLIAGLKAPAKAKRDSTASSDSELEQHAEIMVILKSIALLLAQYKMGNTERVANLEAQVVQSNIAPPEMDPTVEQMKREGLAELKECFSPRIFKSLTRAAMLDDDPSAGSVYWREIAKGWPRIRCFGDLEKCTARELMDIRNFGSGSLVKVRNALRQMDLTLKGETAESSPDYRSE